MRSGRNQSARLLSAIFLMVMVFCVWGKARADFLEIAGDPLKIQADEYATMTVYRWENGQYAQQYFGPQAKGSVLFLSGSDPNFRYGGGSSTFTMYTSEADRFTPVSHAKINDWTIRTVYDAGTTGVQIAQTVSYANGSAYYQIKWVISNTGSTNYSDVRWIHGGDTYFANDDGSEGHWNESLGMVYLKNETNNVSGIMGFYGGSGSRSSHYYEDYYGDVRTASIAGQLPDTVDPVYQDAGYALQWNRSALGPGDTWTIIAFEKWTEAGFVQVVAPAGKEGEPGQTVTYLFSVQNYQAAQDTFNLQASSSGEWATNLPGGNTVTVAANDDQTVTVRVVVPPGASEGTTDTLTLTATSQTDASVGNMDSTVTTVTGVPGDFTVNFTADTGGTISGDTPQIVNAGGDCTTVEAVSNEGYHFKFWDGDHYGFENPLTITGVSSDMNIRAYFKADSYKVKFTAGAGGSISGDTSQKIYYKEDGTPVTAVPNEGYDFAGWSGDYIGDKNPLTVKNVNSDMTIHANFTQTPVVNHTVTFTTGAGGTLSGNLTQTVSDGEDCSSVTAVPDTGYNFSAWSGDYTGTDNPLTLMNVTSDMTIQASFSLIPYTVSFVAEIGGNISGETTQTVPTGGSCTEVTAVPDTGYVFDGWSGDYTGTQNPLTITGVTSDMTFYANFSPLSGISHTISFATGTGGSLSGNPVQILPAGGDSHVVTAVPETGYAFAGWSGDYTGTENPVTLTGVTSDMFIYANFESTTASNYRVTFTSGTSGDLFGNPSQIVSEGETCTTVSAVPDAGFKFVGWSGDYTGTENPLTITHVMSSMTIFANFDPITHTVKFTATSGGGLSGETIQSIALGSDSSPVTAISEPGFSFKDWSGDVTDTANPLTVTNVMSDMEIFANFEENTGNQPPAQPELLKPIDAEIVPPGSIVLRSGAFSDPEDDSHTGSWWQVSRFDDPELIFSEKSDTDLTSYDCSAGLDAGLKYAWRVAYQDSGSGEYRWSGSGTFVVGEISVDENIPPVAQGIQMQDYRMVSFIQWPEDPSAASVFGPMLQDGYDEREFKIGMYDPTLGQGGYREYPDFTVDPGQAYWFLVRNGLDLTVEGVPVSTSADICLGLKFNSANNNGWNMIAPPNDANYYWGDLQVLEKDASGNIVFGPMPVSQLTPDNAYVDIRIWSWSDGSYHFTDDSGFLLMKYNGYWVRAKKSNVYLCFPAGAQLAMGKVEMTITSWAMAISSQLMETIGSMGAAYANVSMDNPPMPMEDFDGNAEGGSGGCFISKIIEQGHPGK